MHSVPCRPRTFFVAVTAAVALGQSVLAESFQARWTLAEKPRLAITKIVATPSVYAQAQAEGTASTLRQILDSAHGQLQNAIHQTRKFELVARMDLDAILNEGDLADSGMVDSDDPQTARAFQLAGARYVATVTVDNFQDITKRTVLEGRFGSSNAERRTIQLQATIKILDTTRGTLLVSTNVPLEMEMEDEVFPGVSQQGRKTNALTGRMTELLASTAARSITDAIPSSNVAPNVRAVGSALSGTAKIPCPACGGTGVGKTVGWDSAAVAGSEVIPAVLASTVKKGAESGREPLRLAIFVRNLSPEVPDNKVSVLEDQITAFFDSGQVELVSRAIVLNAVSSFAGVGSNAGTGDPMNTGAARLLSDQASARSIARNLGADGLLVASISTYTQDTRVFNDPELGIALETTLRTLDIAWSMIDGGTGSSIASGLASAETRSRQSGVLQRKFDPLNGLLRDAASKIAAGVHQEIRSGQLRVPVSTIDKVNVNLSVALADLSVPEIREVDGSWTITPNRYQLHPMACNIIIDGFLAGTAPGVVSMTPGPHRLRVERPMLSPVDKFIVAKEGLALVIPMRLSSDGRYMWEKNTRFLESLKDGEVLRQATLARAEGVRAFLEKSSITVDSSAVRTLWNPIFISPSDYEEGQ